MRLARQPEDIVDGVVLRKRQPVLVVPGVDVVRVDAVKALLNRKIHARLHNLSHVGGVGLHPLLALPVVHLATQVGFLEAGRVGTPVLVGPRREIGDDLAPALVKGCHLCRGVVEQVDDPDLLVLDGMVELHFVV